MKKTIFSKAYTAFFLAALLAVSSIAGFASKVFAAPISDGMAATYVIGQQDFESGNAGTTASDLSQPNRVIVDNAHDRLFIADTENYRVMVYDISSGISTGMSATNVIGQDDLTTTVVSLDDSSFRPTALAYDEARNYLYVGDGAYDRVLIFDVATITDGEPAIYVLGQPDFESSNQTDLTPAGINGPQGLAYDPLRKYLFVSSDTLRVTIFDLSVITNGEDAINVLGQPDFTTGNSAYSYELGGMNYPRGIAYDMYTKMLFVADQDNNRVTVFDMATITDNELPVHVIGQPDLLTRQAAITQEGLDRPNDVWYDAFNKRVYIVDRGNNRVLMYNVASGITDGMDAANVLGQPDYTTNTSNSSGQLISDPKGDYFQTCDSCMSSPGYVTVSPEREEVFVSDGNHRVLVFSLDNTNNGSYPAYFTYSGGSFAEAGANDGTVTGSLVATVYNDAFIMSGTLTQGVHYSVSNVPTGLTPNVSVNIARSIATLTFTGSAAAHANAQDVGNVTLSFLAGSLTNTANVPGVIGSSYSSASVDFTDPAPSNNQNNSQNDSAPSPVAGTISGGSPLRLLPVNPGTVPVAGSSTSYATLRKGSRGDLVKQLQTLLNAKGAYPKLIIDGSFGNATLRAVRAFQTSQKLVSDGIVGMKTWSALIK